MISRDGNARKAAIDEQGEEDEDLEDDLEGRYGVTLVEVDREET